MVDVIAVGIFLVFIFYFNRDIQNTKILSYVHFLMEIIIIYKPFLVSQQLPESLKGVLQMKSALSSIVPEHHLDQFFSDCKPSI